jgi:nucleotide-binding universal stress UspA family protein
VIVAEERKNDEITGVRMSEHLARHGVAVSVKRIAKGDLAVQDVILSYAADSGADFMVMGGTGIRACASSSSAASPAAFSIR